MQTAIQNFNLTLPSSDASFLKTLSKKMGWNLQKAKIEVEEEKHSPLYYELQSAFKDVKLMMDGKKPEKTIEEFLAEFTDEL